MIQRNASTILPNMPNGYTMPRVEVTEQIATSPFIQGTYNMLNATALYKFLIQKHCVDFLTEQYLGQNITPAVSLQMAFDLESLTRYTPYLASVDYLDISRNSGVAVKLLDRVV